MPTTSLLLIDGLSVSIQIEREEYSLVDRVSLTLRSGETLGLVGESGCGKSLTALGALRLIRPPLKVSAGNLILNGTVLKDEGAVRAVRGKKVGMIFQEPTSALNPTLTCGAQMVELLRYHRKMSRAVAKETTMQMFSRVRLPDPEGIAARYPHQLSGGQLQRVMLALALGAEPDFLFADEPTTALDVTVQAQILELLRELQERMGLGILLISHDLGVVAQMAHRVAVMYAGRIVEEGSVDDVLKRPQHPYTQGLIRAVPTVKNSILTQKGVKKRKKIQTMPGSVPTPGHLPTGCSFHPRCPLADEQCMSQDPPLLIDEGTVQSVACWHTGENVWEKEELPC